MGSDQPDLGPGVRTIIGDDDLSPVEQDTSGSDGVIHLRTITPGRHIVVVHDRDGSSDTLPALAERLLWLDGRAGAPGLMASARSDELSESLVIRLSVDAVVCSDPLQPVDPESVATLVGTSLRAIHDLAIADCPFESQVWRWRGAAGKRVADGLVETETSGPYAGLLPQRLLDVLDEMLDSADGAQDDDQVLIHGLPSHRHTWFVPDGSVVFTGWQKFGIGNRHHDLAVAAAALVNKFGPALVPLLMESYGLDRVVPKQLDLHQLMVHLCGIAE